ncbi:unnamed protein product [Cylindrotheca closterium]|uniref:Aminotransferase class I/classII large domain-containing protein n=1 Tax=Cylindrotheca closterium TaxID=2856 RepID=A0AAD2FQW6_9STRA|nr:unnamed protein product [Cylindrotheca closterium]
MIIQREDHLAGGFGNTELLQRLESLPTNVDTAVGRVSRRCQQRALSPPLPYMGSFCKALDYPCDEENPDGFVILCMAENKLVTDILSKRLGADPNIAKVAFADESLYCYTSSLGLPVARQAASHFFTKRFLSSNALQDSIVDPKNIGIASGAAGAMNSLYFALGDAGDVALIPRPYYGGYDFDMSIVSQITPFGFELDAPTEGPTEADLDRAFNDAQSKGLTPRFLLLNNPNNPLASVYAPEVIRNAVAWARNLKLHIIVDEIYALSTHVGHGFQSVVRILDNDLRDDVHVVWALSKDFGASGLRVGFVYSRNETLLQAMSHLNTFSSVSNSTQAMVAELLTDDTFIDYYLKESSIRLRQSYESCVEKLVEMGLPFIPPQAGIFVYVDFSSILPKKTKEYEAKLSQLLIEHARVILTPGDSMKDPTPGMFRMCYAWVSPDVLRVGMERLSRIVTKIRRLDWEDLDETTLSGII